MSRTIKTLIKGDSQEGVQFVWNAKNQITLWGPKGEILDYATKHWAGLVINYHKPRWQLFIAQLKFALDNNLKFNQTQYGINVFESVEKPFTVSVENYSDVATGIIIILRHHQL